MEGKRANCCRESFFLSSEKATAKNEKKNRLKSEATNEFDK